MSQTTLICADDERRAAVRQAPLNGLDYLEVGEDGALTVYFLGKAPGDLSPRNVRVLGGRRILNLEVTDIRLIDSGEPDQDDHMLVFLDRPGDFSTYTLAVVELDEKGRATDQPYHGFDQRYYRLDFSFAAICPSDLDCLEPEVCPPVEQPEPVIDYLAKDYASFRQLILDRLAVIMPDWREQHVPDLGITLVELLAYTGDYLSYYQDAVATEAYLETARQRISVRRHARLVDYHMHEGVNARAFVHVWTATDSNLPADKIAFFTSDHEIDLPADRLLTRDDVPAGCPDWRYEFFMPLTNRRDGQIPLRRAHNEIHFYTWGDENCCLPRGATSATLIDGPPVTAPIPPPVDVKGAEQQPPYPDEPCRDEAVEQNRLLSLEVGDVLIFEEIIGPKTGFPADANPAHRHAVRLTRVGKAVDRLTCQPVLEIAWDAADALPFPLCLSAVGPAPDCALLTDISVARGNVILVDHGCRQEEPQGDPWCVPTERTEIVCECKDQPSDVSFIAGHFRPHLSHGPLTFAEPYPAGPAADMLRQDPRRAAPWIRLTSEADPRCKEPVEPPPDQPTGEPDDDNQPPDQQPAPAQQTPAKPPTAQAGPQPAPVASKPITWQARRDLLDSSPLDYHFVAELDNDGRAYLRFGDGTLGRRPAAGHAFQAVYRVGVGAAGNVGAETIRYVMADETMTGLDWRPRNPLPAAGGVDPEPVAAVKRFAPFAFRHRQERAVTAEDYAAIVMRDFAVEVQKAASVLRWMGSWYEVLVAVDVFGEETPSDDLLTRIETHLMRYRRVGHDVVVRPASRVALDIALRVCVQPGFVAGHVKGALLQRFSNRVLPDGRRGYFHPDNLTFGEGVTISGLVAAAQAVPGVAYVVVERLQRLYQPANNELDRGILTLGPLEIARLDNDPSFPENGALQLALEGGR
jgi:hypothetical protein